MIELTVGDKVKTKLEQPALMCSGRKRVNYYKWWVVKSVSTISITLEDQNGREMITDLSGVSQSGHVIYKVKQK